MKITVFIFALLTSASCLCQEKLDLRNDELITKTFSEQETRGLELMILYVDNMIINREGESNLDKAYHRFFEKRMQKINQSEITPPPFKESQKYQFLKSLDSIQFASVWRFENQVEKLRIKDTLYQNFPQLCMKPHSTYIDYIKKVGKEDSYFNGLYTRFNAIGNLSAGELITVTNQSPKFDFNLPKNRLWAAIFILSMEENYDMKFERYLDAKGK